MARNHKLEKIVGKRFILILLALFIAPRIAWADSGFYLGLELGANFASSLDFDGDDDDRSSICDEYINPQYASVPGCTGPRTGDSWQNSFGSANGILAGAALGYRFGSRFRVEVEYFFRDSKYDDTSGVRSASGETFAKVAGEIRVAEGRLGSFSSHNFFGNVVYDFRTRGKWTPYIGAGLGVGLAEADWSSVWARNTDPAQISTGTGLPNALEIQQNLAGVTSFTDTELDDTLFGYQVLAGLDYALSDSVSIGIKARWVEFGSFQDGRVWETIRGHPGNLRRDGSEAVTYRQKTDDVQTFGVSVGLRYRF